MTAQMNVLNKRQQRKRLEYLNIAKLAAYLGKRIFFIKSYSTFMQTSIIVFSNKCVWHFLKLDLQLKDPFTTNMHSM